MHADAFGVADRAHAAAHGLPPGGAAGHPAGHGALGVHAGRTGPCSPVEPYTTENRPFVDATITEKSVAYIREHAQGDRPFFLYVPFSLVHHPALPHPDFKGRTRTGDFADCKVECDHRSGQILDAVDEAGIADDTIVVWASDNGPVLIPSIGPQADSGPWRGRLGTAYEGQLRTPASSVGRVACRPPRSATRSSA